MLKPFSNSVLVSLTLAVLLSACANKEKSFVIAPQLLQASAPLTSNKSATLAVSDLRTSDHIVQIFQEDKAAELIASKVPLLQVMKTSLAKSFSLQGISISAQNGNTIDVVIQQAKINVQQSMIDYKVDNIIEIIVTVNNGDKTLTQSFKTKGNSNGPLFADLAVLERDFNQQLSQLIKQIVSHTEIQQFLK